MNGLTFLAEHPELAQSGFGVDGVTFLAEHPELAQSGFGVESPRQRQLVITYGLARRHRWDEVTYA